MKRSLSCGSSHACVAASSARQSLQWAILLFALFGATPLARGSDAIPGAPQEQPIALVGGTIHPMTGSAIEEGTVVFEEGRITAVGKDVSVPQNAKTVDLEGKHVYPGLFDAYTNIGLVEIGAVRATRDYSESGAINPSVKAEVAVNPDSEVIPVTRANGVLLALTAPSGGLISGRSAVIQLDGWTWEDMTLEPRAGMHVDWPRMSPVIDWHSKKSARQQAEDRDAALNRLREVFEDARAYRKARAAADRDQARDARWEAMQDVLEGDVPLLVQADEIQEIQAAVAFAEREKVKLIIHGGYDAPHCAKLLKEHEIPVVISSVQRLPRRRDDDYDAPFRLAERLREAGIKFCISRGGASNVRNLPYEAAMAAAYGLPHHEALKAITLYPAQILGVADRVGSLESGKHATLIVTDGDPLETTTHVQAAYVQGREVDLTSKHKQLWRKYQKKYEQLGE